MNSSRYSKKYRVYLYLAFVLCTLSLLTLEEYFFKKFPYNYDVNIPLLDYFSGFGFNTSFILSVVILHLIFFKALMVILFFKPLFFSWPLVCIQEKKSFLKGACFTLVLGLLSMLCFYIVFPVTKTLNTSNEGMVSLLYGLSTESSFWLLVFFIIINSVVFTFLLLSAKGFYGYFFHLKILKQQSELRVRL